jgi:hypothetical protein
MYGRGWDGCKLALISAAGSTRTRMASALAAPFYAHHENNSSQPTEMRAQ